MFLINPYIYGVPVDYLVDDYSPVVAYSVDKLSSTATVCCRVRRASDNAEQDFGFVGQTMDVAAIETFVGTGNYAFIVKVYNQGTGGSTYDITQSVAASQGAVAYGESPPYYNLNNAGVAKPPLDIANDLTFKNAFIVAKAEGQLTVNYFVGADAPLTTAGIFYNGSLAGVNGLGAYDGTNLPSLTGEDLLEHLGYFNMKSSKMYIAKDGAAEADNGAFATSMIIDKIGGRIAASSIYCKGSWKEMVFFNSDETTNKTAIENDINGRYSIY